MKAIQLFKPNYRTSEITELIKQCCDIGWTGIGGKTIEFENAWKEYSGFQTCHMLNSATSGLHLALLQLKMKYGWNDEAEVITTPLTFVSTNHAILYAGLKPVFADIDETGCLNPKDVVRKINQNTKAIIFVGLGGNVGNYMSILEIAKTCNLKTVLDAAHMSGTKHLGGEQFGQGFNVSVFSGQAVKNLPTADSGWICWHGEDAEEQDKISRQLSWLGIDKDTFSRTTEQGSYKWYYDVKYLGYKYHANAIAACFGLVGLKYLDQDNAYRRYICSIYDEHLSNIEQIKIVQHSPDCISSRHLYQICVNNRDEVMMALNQNGIFCGVHYITNTNYEMYKQEYVCENADNFSKTTISLPLQIGMTDKDAINICNVLKKIVK